ncbi:GTP-binding protein [uncultured Clostridium sp.]|jgi:G3E family GTPase|uniref:GTP-binding protein n=1 Tax=uncultured Clostridium sp. TaxID=59620 RepID=UPI0026392082|nr:GTP-binding protein [uncultured Clostridium sp.]
MRKCSVDLVTGFLSSGKTSFINIFLNKTLRREELIVIQCEDGKVLIDEDLERKFNVSVKKFSSSSELNEERLIRLIKFYKPERMIVECNGVEDITSLVTLFNSNKLRAYFKLTGIISILDSLTFNMLIKNLSHLIVPCIERSDLIILNKSNVISEEVLEKNLGIVKNLNTHAHILVAYDKLDLEKKIIKAKVINA